MKIELKLLLLALSAGLFASNDLYALEESRRVEFYEEIGAVAIAEIDSSRTPSLQVAIGLERHVIFEGAYGVSDIENDVKATSEKKYRTASVAKWFTATAALRLSESGALDLDSPIQRYCPQFPDKGSPITARQLLTHTAGIRGYIDFQEAIGAAMDDAEKARLEDKKLRDTLSSYARYIDVIAPLDTFRDDPLLFEPGTRWKYTSFGYRLLACVMQGAARRNFRDLMNELVFGPAGMRNTVDDDAWKIIPERVSGYRLQRGKPLRRADMRDISENLPAGGYLSTATDLVRFALSFNNGLVSEESRKLMSAPVLASEIHAETMPSWRDAIPSQEHYGYGLMLFSKYGDGIVGHTGRQAGGSVILILLPRRGIAIAVMTNAKGWNGYLNFAMKILSVVERFYADADFSAG